MCEGKLFSFFNLIEIHGPRPATLIGIVREITDRFFVPSPRPSSQGSGGAWDRYFSNNHPGLCRSGESFSILLDLVATFVFCERNGASRRFIRFDVASPIPAASAMPLNLGPVLRGRPYGRGRLVRGCWLPARRPVAVPQLTHALDEWFHRFA